MRLLNRFISLVFCLCPPLAPATAITPDPYAPQISMQAVTPEIESATSKAMQDCSPQGTELHGSINKNGIYVLTGDFFQNGRIFAIIDNKKNLVICEWTKSQWKPISAIDLDIVWKFPGWNRDTDGPREPQATQPFRMLTLKGHQVLAVASYVGRHDLQNYAVILFHSNFDSILDTTESLDFSPDVKSHYLVTKDQSQGKAEWDTTYFSTINSGKFAVAVEWHHSYPYNRQGAEEAQPGDDCFTATVNGKQYKIDSDFSKTDPSADWVVSGDFGKGLSTAKLYFTLKKVKNAWENADAGEKEIAYIFEKATGLPRKLYRVETNLPVHGNIESKAKIKVTGSAEAIKLLSPDKSR